MEKTQDSASASETISTKQCPKCGNSVLGLIRSQHLKFCTNKDCCTWFKWTLDEGQQPLIKHQR